MKKERKSSKPAVRTSVRREQSALIPTSGIVLSCAVKKDCCCKPSVRGTAHSPQCKAPVSQRKAVSDIFSIKWDVKERGDKSIILSK